MKIVRRLIGRDNEIDDETLAYVEGRSDADAEARVRASAAAPDEIESLKATVSLLRSVKSVQAPRSFALKHAPVPVRYVPPWFMRAPAMGAAAAVFALAVLVVGDLTGALQQSGGTQGDLAGQSSLQQAESDSSGVTALKQAGSATLEVQATMVASDAASVQERVDGGVTSIQVTAVPSDTVAIPARVAEPNIASSGVAEPEDATGAHESSSSLAGALDGSAPLPAMGSVAPADAAVGTANAEQLSVGAKPGEGFDLSVPDPDAADNLQPGDFGSPPQLPAESSAVNVDNGAQWPLWQTEAALAALAVVMLGAWLLLRRRTAR